MRRACATLLLLVPLFVMGQEVDRAELEALGDADLDFINYEGPHEYVDTIEAIRGIGVFLGREIAPEFGRFSYSGRYTVLHVFDPGTSGGLDADILILEPGAGVDHIVNLRRIISGFLETAYEYSRNDSDVLAKYVTIYNAVVRGDLDFFASRYKPRVMEFLTAEKVGLSLNYVEWPANSQIVIPLMPEAGPGELDSIDFRELIDERVIDRLREEEEMGLEERRSMVELIDRVVEEREAELQEQREELDAEQERADQEQTQEQEREPQDGDQEQPPTRPEEEQPADADRQQETGPDVEADRDDQAQQPAGPQGDQAEEEDPAVDRTDLAEQEQELRELEEAARRERERIAQDTRLLLDEEGPEGVTLGDTEPVYFIEVSRAGSVIRGQLVQINPLTSAVLNRSPESNIITREYRLVSGRVLVIVEDGDVGRLALYDTTTLEQVAVGQEAIYQGSSLAVQGPEATIYAVFADDDQWYVGRFEADLTFRERSYLAVNPDTPLVFTEDQLWVQSRDGVILPLALTDLTVDRR